MKTLIAALAVSFVASTAQAQDYPDRAVTIVVPYAAGGVTDTYARMIQLRLQDRWDQTVVVENKPGGGTLLGAMDVASAEADGYRVLMTAYGVISNEVLMPDAAFDINTLAPVFMLGRSPNMMIMNRDYPLDTLDDITAWAKEHPGELKLSSSGVGSSPHIAAELWASRAGVEILHIPYQGSAPARMDVIAGRVDGMFDGITWVAQIEAGEVKPIAIASEERHPSVPDVPTFRELGMDFVFGTIFGFYVPVETPQAARDELYAALTEAIAEPEFYALLQKQGIDTTPRTQEEFAAIVANELKQLEKLVEEGRLTPQ